MFCQNCGAQIPDGAAFCSGCGTPVGGVAPQPKKTASAGGMPPILQNVINRTVGFFTGMRQEAVVADSVKDTTWSGAILAGVGILVFIFTQLLNVTALSRAFLQFFGADFGDAFKYGSRATEIWPGFWMSLLFAVLYAGALVGMTFVMAKMMKGNLTFLNAVNIAAYASLPVIVISIPNMLFGLLWGLLPMFFMLVAMLISFYLIYRTVSEACGAKSGFLPYTVFVSAMMLIVVLGAYFTANVAIDIL